QYPQLRHGGQQVVDQRGNSVDEVFAVVEDEQGRSRAQSFDDASAQIRPRGIAVDAVDGLPNLEGIGDRVQDLVRMSDRGQLDDMHPRESTQPCDLLGEARL